MMNSQEMERRCAFVLTWWLVHLDDAYGMIRWKQRVDGFPDFGMTFGSPDFAAYARAHYARAAEFNPQTGWYRLWKRIPRGRCAPDRRAD